MSQCAASVPQGAAEDAAAVHAAWLGRQHVAYQQRLLALLAHPSPTLQVSTPNPHRCSIITARSASCCRRQAAGTARCCASPGPLSNACARPVRLSVTAVALASVCAAQNHCKPYLATGRRAGGSDGGGKNQQRICSRTIPCGTHSGAQRRADWGAAGGPDRKIHGFCRHQVIGGAPKA